MQLVKCPTVLTDICPQPDLDFSNKFIFMAGGITGCLNWQSFLIQKLENQRGLILLNPRRDDFNVSNVNMSEKQIEWEFYHLHIADAIIFWFPAETLCPITLYELGVWAGIGFKNHLDKKTLFVGCHPNYMRRFDVVKQLSLIRPEIVIKDNLNDIVDDISKYIDSNI